MSAINYSENEIQAIDALMKANPIFFTREIAAILVLMFARESCMAKQSLIAFLSNYPYLGDRQHVSDALDELIDKKYLILEKDISSGFYKVKINDQIISMLQISYENIADLLKNSREKLECVKTYGKTNSNDNSSLFYQRMQQAQSEICIVYIATEPYISTVSVLKNILANANVKIKLLVADDEICKKLRGTNSPAQKWYDEFKEFNNFQIRVYKKMEGAEIATSTLVDRKILRMTVFDIKNQTTADGYMLEVANAKGYEMNLIHMHYNKFNAIWNSADIYKENIILKLIKKPVFKHTIICIICLILYWRVPNGKIPSLIIPAAFGFFFEKILEIIQENLKKFKKNE